MSTEPNNEKVFWKFLNLDDQKTTKGLFMLGLIVLGIVSNRLWEKSNQGSDKAYSTMEERYRDEKAEHVLTKIELKAAYDTIHKLYRGRTGKLDKRIIENDSIINVKTFKP